MAVIYAKEKHFHIKALIFCIILADCVKTRHHLAAEQAYVVNKAEYTTMMRLILCHRSDIASTGAASEFSHSLLELWNVADSGQAARQLGANH
jgi:hypothetical protein